MKGANTKSKWEFGFSAIQAISAILLTGLALWAFFGSDIPKLLVDQLRTDVTAAKQEVIALRNAKKTLELDLADGRIELDRLSAEINTATDARDAYSERVKQEILSVFTIVVLAEHAELQKLLEKVHSFPEFLNFLKYYNTIEKKYALLSEAAKKKYGAKTRTGIRENSRLYREKTDTLMTWNGRGIPRYWPDSLAQWFREDTYGREQWRKEPTVVLEAMFRDDIIKKIHKLEARYINIHELIRASVPARELSLLSDGAANIFKGRIDQFLEGKRKDVLMRIIPDLEKDFSAHSALSQAKELTPLANSIPFLLEELKIEIKAWSLHQ